MLRLLCFVAVALVGSFEHSALAKDDSKKLDFPVTQAKLGSQTIEIEVADNQQRRSHGLMFRESMASNHGMLFIFDREQVLSFWMKNTLIPLSIGFFDKGFVLVDIQEMEPSKSVMDRKINTYQSRKLAQYALEMNKGWFAKHGIKEGAVLKFPTKPSSPLLQRLIEESSRRRSGSRTN